jgi:hypothetical protein
MEVAEVYRAAHGAGEFPTVAVSGHFEVSHSTAARWVVEARRAGHLGRARGSRSGEATPIGRLDELRDASTRKVEVVASYGDPTERAAERAVETVP